MPKKIWRYTLLSLIGLLFAWLGVHTGLKLLRQPTFDDAILFGVCVFISLRIGYELTLHRASAPVIASSYPARRRMARILKQDADARKVTPYTVVDLGSGCGELVRFIARAIPQANVVGIENAFWPYALAKTVARLLRIGNADFRRMDLFDYDCSHADAVVIYLNYTVTPEVGEKLRKEMKPGALIISNEFELRGGWQAVETITFHTPFKGTLFVYRQV